VCDGVRVDIVATADTGIGPTNRWYRDAVASADTYLVEPGLEVLAIAPIYFIATKLEAFRGRGRGDYQASHDLDDVFATLSGLEPLRTGIETAETEVARAVRSELSQLAGTDAFMDAVAGHFEGDAAGQE
jgi:hypothetical protein